MLSKRAGPRTRKLSNSNPVARERKYLNMWPIADLQADPQRHAVKTVPGCSPRVIAEAGKIK